MSAQKPGIPTMPRNLTQEQVWQRAYKDGYLEGEKAARKLVLDWLETEYQRPTVKRNTPLAAGILDLTKQLSRLLKNG